MRPSNLDERTAKNQFEADMDKKPFEKKLVSFRMPEDLLDALRSRADEENTTVTELVCRLTRQGLQTSPDDRLSALEEEVRELRQLKQVNFGSISPVPIYAPLLPQNVVSEPDVETKQRILRLEAQMEAGFAKLGALGQQMESIAKLEAMMEKVLAVNEAEYNQSPLPKEVGDKDVS